MCKRIQGDFDSFKNNADATLSGGGEAVVKVMGNTPICLWFRSTNLLRIVTLVLGFRIKGRMEKIGRNPEHLKILPGAFVVVGVGIFCRLAV